MGQTDSERYETGSLPIHFFSDSCLTGCPEKEIVMKKLILASLSVIALFGVAACSDGNTDSTTIESLKSP